VRSSDINRDEVRRQLRAADEQQRLAMPGFRDALHRIFGAGDVPAAAKAELLGVPHRRQFIKVGGVTVLGAAVLAACGGSDSDKPGAGETGVTTASTSSTTAPPHEGETEEMDVTLVRTAASLENLAVTVYGVVLGESSSDAKLPVEVTLDPPVTDAAQRFRDHHQAHADALNAILRDEGKDEYTDANPELLKTYVTPALTDLTTQTSIVEFARDLENIAAGTYAYSVGVLTTPDLRQTLIGIGGVESRHATALSLILEPSGATAVPRALTDAGPEGRVPDDALITDKKASS
jgi:hypothetical protein